MALALLRRHDRLPYSPARGAGASLVARRVTFRTTDTAFAAYQKKPEYGPGTITADSVTTDTAEPTLLIEKGSWIAMEKGRLPGQKLDVARYLDGS